MKKIGRYEKKYDSNFFHYNLSQKWRARARYKLGFLILFTLFLFMPKRKM